MELKIVSLENGYVQKIENFEELKKELSERTEKYKNLVYTDEQISIAKADRASLRKLVDALDSRRKEYKKHCLKPYEDFEKAVKTLVGIINEPIGLIDKQVKAFESLKKEEKKSHLECFFYGYNTIEWLKFEMILDEKWLNASVKTEKAVEEIQNRIQQIKQDLETLSNLPDFGFEATEAYKNTLDINKAIAEGQRLAEIQKRKAEEETARMKPTPQEENKSVLTKTKSWVAFEALLSSEDAAALRDFFKSRNIQYNAVSGKERN